MVGLWAVDRARLVGSGDGVVDSTGEERPPRRAADRAGPRGRRLDEASSPSCPLDELAGPHATSRTASAGWRSRRSRSNRAHGV